MGLESLIYTKARRDLTIGLFILAQSQVMLGLSVNQTQECSIFIATTVFHHDISSYLNICLASPESFVPPNAKRQLPPDSLLPKRRTRGEVKHLFPMPVQLSGYCPVAYYDGRLR